jgi:hypothetical protein
MADAPPNSLEHLLGKRLSVAFRQAITLLLGALEEARRSPETAERIAEATRHALSSRVANLSGGEERAFVRRHMVDVLQRGPQDLRRIRRCEYESCGALFFDASPTYASKPARGCPDTSHDVLIVRSLGTRHRRKKRPPRGRATLGRGAALGRRVDFQQDRTPAVQKHGAPGGGLLT